MTRERLEELLRLLIKSGSYGQPERPAAMSDIHAEFATLRAQADERDLLREMLLGKAREIAGLEFEVARLEERGVVTRAREHQAETALAEVDIAWHALDDRKDDIPDIIESYWRGKNE